MSLKARWWWIGGAVLVVGAAVASAVGSTLGVAEFVSALAWTWLVASLLYFIWKLWRWMTYRVGVRLLITYFLIGVLPVFFAVAFAGVGVYILMGQYTSVRLGSELKRVNLELLHQCEMVLQRVQLQGEVAAESLLDQLSSVSHEPFPYVHWQATLGERTLSLAGGADMPPVTWMGGERSETVARYGDRAYSVVTAASESGDRVTALVPMDEVSARAISDAWWFDVAFVLQGDNSDVAPADDVAGDEVEVSAGDSSGMNFTISGQQVAASELWSPWKTPDSGWLSRPLVVWFRVAVDVVDLETGEPSEGGNLVALLRTSPINVWRDFTLSRYELGRELWGVLVALAASFLVGYGLALATAAAVVFSITRSTSRLSAGARAVERGDFDYRVPVKRRDQLGELARTFNHMADSVQSMLADVAEKERLARELELAREIQESLLPARDLEVGPVTVRATFRPAAEVGGDYFDVFPISEDRLVVSIGDVAGHGLSTGLLMASLKSSVAALVHEGYGGSDLIEKVNRLLMEHRQSRTLVTMMVVEIDLEEGRLALTNAGHCPALLIDGEGGIEELMAVSLPMGNPLCSPASLERAFASESRLILYSDGLVEAVSPDGEPFGYQRLEELVRSVTDISGRGLTVSILDALADFTDGVPAADDLTILIMERT